jgi:hypothetical protein
MEREPKIGLGERTPWVFPVQGRLRPEEVIRRKMMQKMMARRERRLASDAGSLGRRAT